MKITEFILSMHPFLPDFINFIQCIPMCDGRDINENILTGWSKGFSHSRRRCIAFPVYAPASCVSSDSPKKNPQFAHLDFLPNITLFRNSLLQISQVDLSLPP